MGFGTIIFVLFLLGSSCSKAQDDIAIDAEVFREVTQALSQELRDVYHVHALTANKIGSLYFDFIAKSIGVCRTKGGNDAVMKGFENSLKFGECIEEIRRTISADRWQNGEEILTLDVMLQRACGQKSKFVTCLNTFKSDVDSCIANEDKKIFTFASNFIESLNQFSCFQGGKLYIEFLNEYDNLTCIHSTKEKNTRFHECWQKELSNQFDKAPELKDALTFNKNGCRNVQTMFSCLKTALKDCRNPKHATLFDMLNTATRGFTLCQQDAPIKGYTQG
ncbi:hypothetical protein B566_EDAN007029 [Ephemera danica]|nr:hypothetical protein B566_EDAN007029 [Ephemera danica]